MKRVLLILFFTLSAVLSACEKHSSPHRKIQPAKIEKPAGPNGVAKITLTSDARSRLGIASQPFPKDRDGKRLIPVSALLYDVKGVAWVFVESPRAEFHRERIQVLQTQGSQIHVQSDFDDSLPVVTQGAAELSGAESGVGK